MYMMCIFYSSTRFFDLILFWFMPLPSQGMAKWARSSLSLLSAEAAILAFDLVEDF